MFEYYFLYILAFIWIVFAVFQDLKYREISNWLNFSLIAFVLAYRLIYSNLIGDYSFFVNGVIGILLFIGIGYALYYGRVFAGGDAKLLFGLGGIFPYANYYDFAVYGLGFLFLLLSSGVVYTIIYSSFIAFRNKNNFVREFVKNFRSYKIWFFASIILSLVTIFFFKLFFWVPLILFFVFIYAKAIEKSSMIRLISPQEVTEGDWLYESVKVNGRLIEPSVHGLSYEEILFLRKSGKNVRIRFGIPFAPAFLIALIMYFIYAVVF